MKNLILAATVVATVFGVTSTEALALSLMGPESLEVHKGMLILAAPTGKTDVVRGEQMQADLQQIKTTEVPSVSTSTVGPTRNIFTQAINAIVNLWN